MGGFRIVKGRCPVVDFGPHAFYVVFGLAVRSTLVEYVNRSGAIEAGRFQALRN